MENFLRSDKILEFAERNGHVSVDRLADHFDVSLQTIRRDLNELSKANKLVRVHGGAVLPSGTMNIAYEARRNMNADAKARIAAACAYHIPDGSSVFLNIGTSTEAVAQALMQHRDLMLITNNMNVARVSSQNMHCRTILTGGTIRPADQGLVGSQVTDFIRQFRFDVAVIGCSALDQTGDVLDYDVEEVAASQTIIQQARTCFLVADASKLARTAPVKIASLRDLSGIYTDAPLPSALAGLCKEWNTDVFVAPR